MHTHTVKEVPHHGKVSCLTMISDPLFDLPSLAFNLHYSGILSTSTKAHTLTQEKSDHRTSFHLLVWEKQGWSQDIRTEFIYNPCPLPCPQMKPPS